MALGNFLTAFVFCIIHGTLSQRPGGGGFIPRIPSLFQPNQPPPCPGCCRALDPFVNTSAIGATANNEDGAVGSITCAPMDYKICVGPFPPRQYMFKDGTVASKYCTGAAGKSEVVATYTCTNGNWVYSVVNPNSPCSDCPGLGNMDDNIDADSIRCISASKLAAGSNEFESGVGFSTQPPCTVCEYTCKVGYLPFPSASVYGDSISTACTSYIPLAAFSGTVGISVCNIVPTSAVPVWYQRPYCYVDPAYDAEQTWTYVGIGVGALLPYTVLFIWAFTRATVFQRTSKQIAASFKGRRGAKSPGRIASPGSSKPSIFDTGAVPLLKSDEEMSNLGESFASNRSMQPVVRGRSLGFYQITLSLDLPAKGLAGSLGFCGWGKKESKTVLNNVSGRFRAGKLTAIMGPSGCGKTTLLNLLSGQARMGTFSGLRLLDGALYTQASFEQAMRRQGYVQQTDTFFEDLTCTEMLNYSALLRLGEGSMHERIALVQNVIDVVDLRNAADNKIGGVTFKGISGGQRRRLSIGTELLRMPELIMLDEPTSGLDATSSLKLVRTLKDLTCRGHTVVTTIHQPRAEIFGLFDDLLLLAEGGHVVYHGSALNCVPYLAAIPDVKAHMSPANYDNPGDFVIDCLGLDPEKEDHSASTATKNTMSLPQAWQKSSESVAILDDLRMLIKSPADLTMKEAPEGWMAETTSFRTQVWVLFARRWIRAVSASFVWNCLMYFQVAVIAGVIAYTFTYVSSIDQLSTPYQVLMILSLVGTYAMVLQYLILVPEYYDERPIVLKERDSVVVRFDAYILSGALAELPRAALQVAVLVGVAYFFVTVRHVSGTQQILNPEACYGFFFYVMTLVGTVAWQAMIACACSITDSVGNVYTVIFMILGLGTLFGGTVVAYEHIPDFFYFAYYISVPALTLRALIFNDMRCCAPYLTANCSDLATSQDDPTGGLMSRTGTVLSAASTVLGCSSSSAVQYPMNIGSSFLWYMSMPAPDKTVIMIVCIVCTFVFRLLALLIFWVRDRRVRQLREVDHEGLVASFTALCRRRAPQKALIDDDVDGLSTPINGSRGARGSPAPPRTISPARRGAPPGGAKALPDPRANFGPVRY